MTGSPKTRSPKSRSPVTWAPGWRAPMARSPGSRAPMARSQGWRAPRARAAARTGKPLAPAATLVGDSPGSAPGPRDQGAAGQQRDRDERQQGGRRAAGGHQHQADEDCPGHQAEDPRIPRWLRHSQHRGRAPRCRALEPEGEQPRAEHDQHRGQRDPQFNAGAGDPGEDHRDGGHRGHGHHGGVGQPLTQPAGRPQDRSPEIAGQHSPGHRGQQRADQVGNHLTPPDIELDAGAGGRPNSARALTKTHRTLCGEASGGSGFMLPAHDHGDLVVPTARVQWVVATGPGGPAQPTRRLPAGV